MIRGIDISSYQDTNGTIDYKAVAQAGYSFVFVKATQGTHYRNPYLTRNVLGFRGAGLDVGVYHYAEPEDVEAQYNYFMAETSSLPCTLIPFVDLEQWATSDLMMIRNTMCAMGSLGQYCDRSTYATLGKGNSAYTFLAIEGEQSIMQFTGIATILQVSSTGVVPGILGDVDIDLATELPLKTGMVMGKTLNAPIVGGATHPTEAGYWLVGADGGVFAFGAAKEYGSLAGKQLLRPIVGIVASSTGNGYALIGADGGIFAFGDYPFSGSIDGLGIGPAPV